MAEEELREREGAAVAGSQEDLSQGHTSNVTGKGAVLKSGRIKRNSLMIFGVAILVILLILILQVPIFAIDHISTSIIEQTDQQYTDEVKSKALVFQEGLKEGYVPEDTFERMEKEGVTIGYFEGETFIASNMTPYSLAAGENTAGITLGCEGDDCKTLSIKMGDTVIPADRFYYEVNNNLELYNAFTNSTYGRAGYYYDAEAQRVFRELGTSRNSFNGDKSLDEVMDNLMGTGHSFGTDSESWVYLPLWKMADEYDPDSVVLDRWDTVQSNFSCNGTGSSGRAYWRDPQVYPIPHYIYDDNGNVVDVYYTYGVNSIDRIDDSYGCITNDSKNLIRTVSQSNMNLTSDYTQTNLNTADTLKVADTATKEKRSILLYVGIAESFSKTKAGYGSTKSETNSILSAIATIGATTGGSADVNDVMNWLYDSATTYVTDTTTGEQVSTTGSAVESPSLYAILTGEMIEASEVKNYSSDRITDLVESKMGISTIGKNTMGRTITTANSNGSVKVGRCTENSEYSVSCDSSKAQSTDTATASYNVEQSCEPDTPYAACWSGRTYNNGDAPASITDSSKIIEASMYENSFSSIKGNNAGEMLVEGAVNLGRELAKASGSSAGNNQAVNNYLAMTKEVLAMDAAIDRINRSPLDVTSKNTFLGSIVYKFAVSSMKSGSLLNKVASVSKVAASAVKTILPSANAEDDEEDLYLGVFGDCETLNNIRATGSATCSVIATFDTSTYGGDYGTIYSEKEFTDFLAANVKCDSNSTCEPIENSYLAKFIAFNELRNTPLGTTDGAILESIWQMEEDNKNIFAKALSAIANLFGVNKKAKTIDFNNLPAEATGEAFVIGSDEWKNYKMAQRYVSLARAAETLRQYSGDATAYNFEGFGLGNPVARYIEKVSGDTIAAD